jgi:hypothetical protein
MGIDEVQKDTIIAERRKNARPLVTMARTVAEELGERHQKKHGAWHDYRDEDHSFSVSYDDYGNNLDVHFNSVKVLNVHLGRVTGYIPGERWESILRKKNAEASVPIHKRKRKQVKKEVSELEEKWGIKPHEVGAGGRTSAK